VCSPAARLTGPGAREGGREGAEFCGEGSEPLTGGRRSTQRNPVTQIAGALRVKRSYRPAVVVLGRSSMRTSLNSVLNLCAPHWGQRSADDHDPHREHVLCARFGTTTLPFQRCRIFRFLKHLEQPNEMAPKQVDSHAAEFAARRTAKTSSTNFNQIGSLEGTPFPPSLGSGVLGGLASIHGRTVIHRGHG
jgi:hypothetical protein